MQGVRAYQRPYRAIAEQAVDKEDYDCPLCFRLFWQPVVTSCGHTYCKVKTHFLLCLVSAADSLTYLLLVLVVAGLPRAGS